MADIDGTIQILVETVQDRIVGYPDLEGWEEGNHVPFMDQITQQPKYPLNMPPAPLDWTITNHVLSKNNNITNLEEHFPNRQEYLSADTVSTSFGSYHMQGSCNPDPESYFFREGCSDASNNLTTGGSIQPTSTHWGLYQTTGDLTVFMKPLFEIQTEAVNIKIHFVNQGAGATLQYPATTSIPPSSNHSGYTSHGCDWMEQINPRNGKPYGTKEDIARCHKAGTVVPSREYNPMEEPWVSQILRQPDQVRRYGPIQKTENCTTIIKAIKAVFDRLQELVEQGAVKPQVGTVHLKPGDWYLLCSDGIVDGLWNHHIEEIISAGAAG